VELIACGHFLIAAPACLPTSGGQRYGVRLSLLLCSAVCLQQVGEPRTDLFSLD
jgi:hypothetical protein